MNRSRILLSAVVLLILFATGPAAEADERGFALVYTDPTVREISGGQTAAFDIIYDGSDVTEGLRGYHLEISFNPALVYVDDVAVDIVEGSFLTDVGSTAFFAVDVSPGVVVIDGAILGDTTGAFGAGDLFSITFTGQPTGDGVTLVQFTDIVLRDQDNFPIGATAVVGIIVLDNTPPNVPVLDPEPEFTLGTINRVSWSNESASGAVGYCVEASETPDFAVIVGTSGCTPFTWYNFTELNDDQIYYFRVKCRDALWNMSDWSDAEYSTQDDSAPYSEAGPLDPYYNTVVLSIPYTSGDVTSGVDFVRLFYRVDGGTWTQHGGTYTASPIGFAASGEGIYDFYTRATDNVENVEMAPTLPDCTTEVDLTPPAAVVDMETLPGHNRIHLSWTVPTTRDAPIEGTLIMKKAWGTGAYPEYDDWGTPAGYPGNPTDGTVVAFVPGTGARTYDDETFTDATRNVYYYTAFARDAAGNYSVAATSAQDRSTSYWLADVDEMTGTPGVYDGNVDFYDKIILSDSYDTQYGDTYYEPEMDVGPTDDWSRFGIPLTDDAIDFEDLMIVAMNYDRVDPLGKVVAHDLAGGDPLGPLSLVLATISAGTESGADVIVVLALEGNCAEVKGLSAELTYDPGTLELVGVEPSDALSDWGDDIFFYWAERPGGGLRIDIASLGTDVAIGGSGPLAELRFRAVVVDQVEVGFARAKLRGIDNGQLECRLLAVGAGSEEAAGDVIALAQNIPNPFNPVTMIAFDVPREARVSLSVYSVSGRRLARLVEGVCGAGRHTAAWDGKDDNGVEASSSVYFYVLEVGEVRLEKRMVLMR